MVGLVAIVLFVTVVQGILPLASLYIVILATYWRSGLPVKKLFQWYLLPAVFVLSLVFLLMWNEPGRPLISLSFIGMNVSLTDNGLMLVVGLLLKALISMTYSLLFLMTTRYAYLSAMIYRIFPSPIDQVFLMSYRFIFITLKMVNSMMKALKSRGGGLIKGMTRQSQLFAEVFALVFIRSFDRAERVNKAMESRGYSGKYVAATGIPRLGGIEYIFILGMLLAAAYQVLLKLI
jgi:cobalt/nickel transport system permease protein